MRFSKSCIDWNMIWILIQSKAVVNMIKCALPLCRTHWTAARYREEPRTAAAEETVPSERPVAPSPSGDWWTLSSPAGAASEGFWWWSASEKAPSCRSQPAGTPRPPSGLQTSTEREEGGERSNIWVCTMKLYPLNYRKLHVPTMHVIFDVHLPVDCHGAWCPSGRTSKCLPPLPHPRWSYGRSRWFLKTCSAGGRWGWRG